MSTSTAQNILAYIEKNGQASPKELVDYLGSIGGRAVRKQLKNLLTHNKLRKIGRPPKVYYLLSQQVPPDTTEVVDFAIQKFVDERYLYISPTGKLLSGWTGFLAWCKNTQQDPLSTARAYVATVGTYDQFRRGNFIDGMPKLKRTFPDVFLDTLFYLDFYSVERFGKTKLGQMLLYAKQSQNRELISKLIDEIRPRIVNLIKRYRIDGVLYIPPTVKREVQFMKEMEKRMQLSLRMLSVAKVKTDIIIPQKTLTKLEDRVENARSTIIVEDMGQYNNILLIDDAVGSGATLNETARQIKNRNLCTGHIVGLAITGSFRGFDVISEV
jgi:hypoxanthine-guanine phosphoribosyltransferase